jgi:WXG100 family type VII secretion target
MGATTIRSKFDELERVAAVFGGQADGTRRLLQKLQRQIDELQGGGWVGRGAKAFYAEMENKVTPAVNSLAGALDSAAQNTQKASQVMQQAELEVTRLFGAQAGRGGAAAGPMDEVVKAAGASVGAAGAGAIGEVSAAAGGAVVSAAKAALRVLEDAAVDLMLSKFSQKVRDLAKQSPTLRSELLDLQLEGYTVKTGPVADGYFIDWDKNVIVIDQPRGDTTTVAHLAHEVGHGVNAQRLGIPATPSMTKAQYVKANVDNLMHNEGEAQLNAARVRAELKSAGGPDIGIPGTQTAKYQKVYDNFTANKITRDKAVNQMGTLMGNETVSTPPHKPYRQDYGDAYSEYWDKKIAPGRKGK